MRARRFFSLSLSLKQHTRSLLLLKEEEEEEEEEETLLKTCLFIRVYNWGIIGRAKKARTTRRVMTSMTSFPTRERNDGASSSSPNTNATTLTPSPVVPQSEKEKEKEKHFGRGLMMTEEDPTFLKPSRAEHFILGWISIRPSVTRLVQFGLDPFREEIRFVLEGVLWKEISSSSSSDYDGKKNSSSSSNTNNKNRRRKRRLLWTKGISVRVVIVFLILYPNYIAFAACAAFIRASLRARRRATRRRETSEKEEELAIPRMSTYSVVVLETIADRLETIASIASGRDPLALRVACFGCAWLFVLSFFVSFNAWFATFVLFATKPKGATKVLEALFR